MLCKMPRFAQLVMGPAGSGKSSFCSQIVKHCEVINRVVHVVNLDPAADYFDYPVYADVRELVSVEDVMEDSDLRFGPNGGLVFCMEYLIENLDWLKDQLDEVEEDYILFDCPGQIELYTHLPVMKKLVDCLTNWNFHVCGVFLIDAQFMIEPSKFVSGVMSALSAMVSLEIPHVNVMTKLDLLNKQARKQLQRYLDPDMKQLLMEEMSQSSHLSPAFQKLNQAIAGMIDDYSLVGFQGLDVTDEESIHSVLVNIDTAIQYGEDMEHKESKEIDQDLDGLREGLPSDLNGD